MKLEKSFLCFSIFNNTFTLTFVSMFHNMASTSACRNTWRHLEIRIFRSQVSPNVVWMNHTVIISVITRHVFLLVRHLKTSTNTTVEKQWDYTVSYDAFSSISKGLHSLHDVWNNPTRPFSCWNISMTSSHVSKMKNVTGWNSSLLLLCCYYAVIRLKPA